MALRDDDRGVSEVIGVALILVVFSLAVLLLQTQGVPAWNQAVEFDHNQRVQDDIERLHNALTGAAADGSPRSIRVRVSADYPNRFLLQNPPDPTGRLTTTRADSVVVTNATASGETADYWDGGSKAFETRPVTYRPNYNYYDTAPTTVLETGVVYNRFGSTNITLTDQSLIADNRISLITTNGTVSASQAGAASIAITPLSAPTNAIAVTNESAPVSVTIPTRLPNATWRELLADEYVENGGHVVGQTLTRDSPYDRLEIRLEAGVTYELRMAKVGSQQSRPNPPRPTSPRCRRATSRPEQERQYLSPSRSATSTTTPSPVSP